MLVVKDARIDYVRKDVTLPVSGQGTLCCSEGGETVLCAGGTGR